MADFDFHLLWTTQRHRAQRTCMGRTLYKILRKTSWYIFIRWRRLIVLIDSVLLSYIKPWKPKVDIWKIRKKWLQLESFIWSIQSSVRAENMLLPWRPWRPPAGFSPGREPSPGAPRLSVGQWVSGGRTEKASDGTLGLQQTGEWRTLIGDSAFSTKLQEKKKKGKESLD